MKEYQVVASVYEYLLTTKVLKRPMIEEFGFYTPVHTIKCDSPEEIPDLFLDQFGQECHRMKTRIYWYVNDGNGWMRIDL